MLPKVSFIADKNETNGNECLSRRGKMTTFHYPIFQSKDPIAVHERAMKRVQKEQKSMTHGIIPGKPPTAEQMEILQRIYEEQDREIRKK